MSKGSRMKNANGLTDLQQAFADAYLLNGGNGQQAYLTAHEKVYGKKYEKESTGRAGSELLSTNPKLTDYINRRRKEQAEKHEDVFENAYKTIVETCARVMAGEKIEDGSEIVQTKAGSKVTTSRKVKYLTRAQAMKMLADVQGLTKRKVELSGEVKTGVTVTFTTLDDVLKDNDDGAEE